MNIPTTDRKDSPGEIDFAAAAKELGINEQTLRDAFGGPTEPPKDIKAIAQQLDITE